MSKPASRARAPAVYESRPPLNSTTALLDAADIRTPDVLVNLKLQAHRHAIFENPLQQVFRVHHTVHGREQYGGTAAVERVPRDDVARKLVVGSILDDELHLIA